MRSEWRGDAREPSGRPSPRADGWSRRPVGDRSATPTTPAANRRCDTRPGRASHVRWRHAVPGLLPAERASPQRGSGHPQEPPRLPRGIPVLTRRVLFGVTRVRSSTIHRGRLRASPLRSRRCFFRASSPRRLEPCWRVLWRPRFGSRGIAFPLGRRLNARIGVAPKSDPNLHMLGGDLLSRGPTAQVPSALAGLTSVFGMGTGGSLPLWPPKLCEGFLSPP